MMTLPPVNTRQALCSAVRLCSKTSSPTSTKKATTGFFLPWSLMRHNFLRAIVLRSSKHSRRYVNISQGLLNLLVHRCLRISRISGHRFICLTVDRHSVLISPPFATNTVCQRRSKPTSLYLSRDLVRFRKSFHASHTWLSPVTTPSCHSQTASITM